MAVHPGLFDLDRRYAALSAAGDPLERLALVVSLHDLLNLHAKAALRFKALNGFPCVSAVSVQQRRAASTKRPRSGCDAKLSRIP